MSAVRTWLNRHLKQRGYYLGKIPRGFPAEQLASISIGSLLEALRSRKPGFGFIQIGANDGRRADDIYSYVEKYQLAGLLVEPLPDMMQALRNNYRHQPRVVFEQAALHPSASSMRLWRFPEGVQAADDDLHGMASFNKQSLQAACKLRGLDDVELSFEEVPCLSFDALLAKHSIAAFEFLQIDVEGFDYEVLKMVNFDKYKPELLRFEHQKLSVSDYQAALRLLNGAGYTFFPEYNDTIAVLTS